MEIVLFRPRNETFQEFYAEDPVDIVVRGAFHNAVGFFDNVGKLNRIVNIDNIEFRNPNRYKRSDDDGYLQPGDHLSLPQ